MASESDSDLSSDDLSEETASWIAWFCSIRGNEFFCQVDEEYITDSFNLSGLKEEVPYYDMAVETILDSDQPHLNNMSESQQESVDAAAELLYGLIHARFILTAKGLTLMVRGRTGAGARGQPPPPHTHTHALAPPHSSSPPASPLYPFPCALHPQNEKFLECTSFGQCANYLCAGQALLPVGIHDQPRRSNVHLFCPRCNGVFHPPSSRHASECAPPVASGVQEVRATPAPPPLTPSLPSMPPCRH